VCDLQFQDFAECEADKIEILSGEVSEVKIVPGEVSETEILLGEVSERVVKEMGASPGEIPAPECDTGHLYAAREDAELIKDLSGAVPPPEAVAEEIPQRGDLFRSGKSIRGGPNLGVFAGGSTPVSICGENTLRISEGIGRWLGEDHAYKVLRRFGGKWSVAYRQIGATSR
jgi:hypothetical protein